MVVGVPLLRRRLRWALVAVIVAAIVAASVTRPTGIRDALGPLGLVGRDKWLHGLAYATLALTLAYAFAERDATVAAVVALAAAVAVGLGVELLQASIPYRTFAVGDLLANAVGATAVAVGWRVLAPRVRFRRRASPGE